MQLPCLYCGVILLISQAHSAWSSRTDSEKFLKLQSLEDTINTEALQHDLAWDDTVDGSYDVDSARWDRAPTWQKTPASSRLPTAHFRPVGGTPDGEANAAPSSHKKDLNEEVPFYLKSDKEADMHRLPSSTVNTVGIELEKPTVDDLKEVEITLGKDDGQIDLSK